MDAFFASVEQLDNPKLRGKAIAVGGNKDRGVIAAASYEARKYGVKSAMSSKIAARMCPELIFVKPNFERYKEVSQQINAIFHRFTNLVEPLSLDEAFLDVTENFIKMPSATFIAQTIKTEILNEVGLIASAGVSYNKFLAKLASDQDKPNGLFVIAPDEAQRYIDEMPIHRFYGVGTVMADKMHELQIYKGKDLKRFTIDQLTHFFGKTGNYLFQICRGVDERPVVADRLRKSIAVEKTLNQDIFDSVSFYSQTEGVMNSVWERYNRIEKRGKTITLKVKFGDFTISNRSKTSLFNIHSKDQLVEITNELMSKFIPLEKPVRLIGIQISNFNEESYVQTELFHV
jgi:DNA polymerase-4